MSKITEYYAVHDDNAEMLTEKVNELIKQGWQPFGGISTTTSEGHTQYIQAMVEYSEKTE